MLTADPQPTHVMPPAVAFASQRLRENIARGILRFAIRAKRRWVRWVPVGAAMLLATYAALAWTESWSKGVSLDEKLPLLGVATGLLVFWSSREIFGAVGGLISLALFAFSPSMLAFGMVSPDALITLTLFAATRSVWRLLHAITAGRLVASVGTVGLLLLAKPTELVIVPIAAVLISIRLVAGGAVGVSWGRAGWSLSGRWRQLRAFAALALAHALAGWVAIWAHYDFRYNASPQPADPALEMPHLALILLLALGAIGWWWTRCNSRIALWTTGIESAADSPSFYEATPYLTLIGCYLAVALNEDINTGQLHILPIYPAVYVLAGSVSMIAWQRVPRLKWVVLAMIGWLAVDSVEIRPYSLADFGAAPSRPSWKISPPSTAILDQAALAVALSEAPVDRR